MGGGPYSGKSTIAGEFAGSHESVAHLSMGDHIRAIVAGEVESRYAADLRGDLSDLKRHIPAPEETTLGVFREFMDANSSMDLIVVDGHPREADIPVLREVGAIAICRVSIPDTEAIARSQARAQRFEDAAEDEASVQKRLETYMQNTYPVLDQLSVEFPFYEMDGLLPVEDNAALLLNVYRANSRLGATA